MKIRDSGMPEEGMWAAFFNPPYIFRQLQLPSDGIIVDLGCGYGTFTIPAAQMTKGTVYAYDIEANMISNCRKKATALGLTNVIASHRDFIADGTGLEDGTVDYVMLFNVMHAKHPVRLLGKTHRLLRSGGKTAVIHWNYDPTTPRGPVLTMRPRPEKIVTWLKKAGFKASQPIIDLPPYHYGVLGVKP